MNELAILLCVFIVVSELKEKQKEFIVADISVVKVDLFEGKHFIGVKISFYQLSRFFSLLFLALLCVRCIALNV